MVCIFLIEQFELGQPAFDSLAPICPTNTKGPDRPAALQSNWIGIKTFWGGRVLDWKKTVVRPLLGTPLRLKQAGGTFQWHATLARTLGGPNSKREKIFEWGGEDQWQGERQILSTIAIQGFNKQNGGIPVVAA